MRTVLANVSAIFINIYELAQRLDDEDVLLGPRYDQL